MKYYDEYMDDFSVCGRNIKSKKNPTNNNRLNKKNKKKTNYKPVYNKKHIRNKLEKINLKKNNFKK
tara:strand:+ start:176 stop:373 length:198 start_codon:yes stop_codon:yes gene_type:complete